VLSDFGESKGLRFLVYIQVATAKTSLLPRRREEREEVLMPTKKNESNLKGFFNFLNFFLKIFVDFAPLR